MAFDMDKTPAAKTLLIQRICAVYTNLGNQQLQMNHQDPSLVCFIVLGNTEISLKQYLDKACD